MPFPVGGEGSERYCVVVAARHEKRAVNTNLIPANAPVEIANFVIATMNGNNAEGWRGLPQSVLFTSLRAWKLMEAILAERDVDSEYAATNPKLDFMAETIAKVLARGSSDAEKNAEAENLGLDD